MKKIHLVVAGTLLLATGVLANLTPRAKAPNRTESWMAQRLPETFDGYKFSASSEDPNLSYRMSDVTYDTLKAYGIISRIYEKGDERVDTVVIASQNSDSFHDPRICFQSQGSYLDDQKTGMVHTATRGDVPATFLTTDYEGQKHVAAYMYKGPNGFKAEPLPLILDMFLGEFRTAHIQEGVFYRFIALDSSTTQDDLSKYMAKFLDSASKKSSGYF